MVNVWESVAGALSTILRISAFIFLRWIPGHHFPPLIITALVSYLTLLYYKFDLFARPSLHQAFPALFRRKDIDVLIDRDRDTVEVVETEYEDPIVYEDEHSYFKTLLFGIPDWRELDFSYITVTINILLALLSLDLVFRGPLLHSSHDLKFSRLGFVDHDSAKVLVREPNAHHLPIYAYYKTENEVQWREGERIYYLGFETDFTHPIVFTGLDADTAYVYSLSNNLTGSFKTAPAPRTPQAGSLTFLTSSCIKANFPYRLFSHSLAIHGFEHLSWLVRSLPSPPAFMLFLGDFIYVDVPQRLSSSFAHYRSEYRRVYASPSWNLRGLSTIPWIHTLDDHEIANDWSGGNKTAPFPAASDPFIHYHVSVNPPLPPSTPEGPHTNATYFQFTQGPASFFMLDTRRYRTDPEQSKESTAKPFYGSSEHPSNPPGPAEEPASMLGTAQLESLLRFLRTPEPSHVYWKFVASSVPFTKNWRFGTSDTWGGFLTERSTILQAMHEAESQLGIRVVVLSGDRHEFAAIRFPPPVGYSKGGDPSFGPGGEQPTIFDRTPQAGPHEFSVGPLSMFYLPIRTFKQIDGQDVAIKYLPDGNSKVGVISVENLVSSASYSSYDVAHEHEGFLSNPLRSLFGAIANKRPSVMNAREHTGGEEQQQKSLLRYSLWIDGKVAWEYTLTSPGPRSPPPPPPPRPYFESRNPFVAESSKDDSHHASPNWI